MRIFPLYPIRAARLGIEGWVKLSFSVNEKGGVEDVKVIEARPKRIFNTEAIRALKRWKYRAKIVNGTPVKQHGLVTTLDFNLDQLRK